MKNILKITLLSFLLLILTGCGIYSFTGAGPINAKSFQVNYFLNNALLIEPGIERTFTVALQDLIQNQTNLVLTNADGELVYEGEIVDYRITPMAATANQLAAQNRLTIAVNVRFMSKNNPEDDFEKRFSHFYDYSGDAILTGGQLNTAINEIYERITQDVFTASLAKW
jgi:outer membrane lipopolysaccharide assembly protein LptE/RlpB